MLIITLIAWVTLKPWLRSTLSWPMLIMGIWPTSQPPTFFAQN